MRIRTCVVDWVILWRSEHIALTRRWIPSAPFGRERDKLSRRTRCCCSCSGGFTLIARIPGTPSQQVSPGSLPSRFDTHSFLAHNPISLGGKGGSSAAAVCCRMGARCPPRGLNFWATNRSRSQRRRAEKQYAQSKPVESGTMKAHRCGKRRDKSDRIAKGKDMYCYGIRECVSWLLHICSSPLSILRTTAMRLRDAPIGTLHRVLFFRRSL